MNSSVNKGKNKENKMSFQRYIKYVYFYAGILWCGIGIMNFFENVVCKVLSAIIGVVVVYMLLYPFFCKDKEAADEMAKYNMYRAIKDSFFVGMIMIFIVITIMEVLHTFGGIDFTVSGSTIVSILHIYTGMQFTISAVIFKKLENE